MNPTDLELWQQACAGDRDAFVALAERHAPSLHRLAYHMTGHRSDSQDLVQETLLAAYQSLDRFRQQASVRTWLVRILTLQVAQHRRRERYRKTQSLDRLADHSSGPLPDRSTSVAAADAQMDLHDLLQKLPLEYRQALLLREIEGLSYRQIAQMLDWPEGTVESRIFRARRQLAELAKASQAGESS